MQKPNRRAYVAPDVKHYGAVEQVTQMIFRSGPGDWLSTTIENELAEEGHDVDIEGCPLFQTCAS